MHEIQIFSISSKAHEKKFSSGNVVFPAWRENIDYERLFDRARAVLHAAANNESVPRAQFESLAETVHPQMSADYVHNLIMRMAMHGSSPPFHHLMFSEKELVVIGEHSAREAWFRMGLFGLITPEDYKVGISFVLCFHLCPPV
jgi:hypothetical protein